MPVARYKTTIDASFAEVSRLLDDKVDKPRMYVSAVQHSKILERHDDYVVREMFQPSPVPMTIREKIYAVDVPGGTDFVFDQIGNERYTGAFHNILTRVEGRDDQVQVEYFMDWHPHPGTDDAMPLAVAEKMVKGGVEHLKSLAEHPVEVPSWVREFFLAADSMKPEALEPLLHDDIRFRVGNNVEVVGKANMLESSKGVTKIFAAMTHHYVDVDVIGERAYVDCFVEYTNLASDTFLIPFLTKMERRDGKVYAVLASGDMSPLRHGW
jgi:hypothetical protein